MLAIALKSSDSVDLRKVLSQYISKNFGSDAQVQPLVEKVGQMRKSSLDQEQGPEGQRQAMSSYLGALSLLEGKLPFGAGQDHVNVQFNWYDSFRPQTKASSPSLQLERASLVFNLASLYSVMGRDCDRSGVEGQKQAIQHFTKAAGLYCLIKDQLLPAQTPTVDLSDHALQLCTGLMLAQAQAVYYEKGVKDKLGRGLLSKLACQASTYFKTAGDFAQRLDGKIDPSWRAHCTFQEQAFLAAAHYQLYLLELPEVEKELSGFGKLITRLKLAAALCSHALEVASLHHLNITEAVVPLHQTILAELGLREKDNNTVYFETVPAVGDLAPLQGVSAVKVTPLTLGEVVDYSAVEGFKQVLEGLVPQEVQQRAGDYRQRAEALLSEVEGVVRRREGELGASLQARGLPLALDPPSHGLLPDVLWAKIQSLQVSGGMQAVNAAFDMLQQMEATAEGKIQAMRQRLEAEAQEDQQLRSSLRLNRVPSAQASLTLLTQLNDYQSKLKAAALTNQQLKARLGQVGALDLLARSKSDLEQMCKGAGEGALGSDEYLRGECRQALTKLDEDLAAVRKELEEFKSECNSYYYYYLNIPFLSVSCYI